MEINKYMFREYDIRGVWGKDITEETSYLIGKAFGTQLIRKKFSTTLIGYDNRKSSTLIEKNLIKGITECGVNVVRIGLVTTPMYYFGWNFLDIKCGMMITASHNPKDDNGFKFSYNGINNAYGNSSNELYNLIINNDFELSDNIGLVTTYNIKDEYIKYILNCVDIGENKLKVVYDCGNGTTCVVADDIFNSLRDKVDFIPLFNDSDPDFPNHHPDPSVEENLTLLKKCVLEKNADLGIAFDGDGDRIGVIDNEGSFIDMDKFMIIVWRYLVNTGVKKKTFFDIKCGLALKDELDKLGIENEYYRTGNSYTKMKSVEGNYPFSGELSGHVYFRDKFIGNDDGIYAGLRLVEILSKTGKRIPDMLTGINHYYCTPEIKVPTNDDIKFEIVKKIEEYAKQKDYKLLTIDGAKIFFDHGSALVRASNTGPNLTCRFESKYEDKLEEIKKEFLDKIEEYSK